MSASNWDNCPQCERNAKELKSQREEEAHNGYGKVSAGEYAQLVRLADEEISIGTTLREDYQQFITIEGEYKCRYTCHCDVCGFHYKYKYTEQVLK